MNGTTRLAGIPVQIKVPAESMADVITHSFWTWGTTEMFGIIIVNLDAGSFLRMTPKKALEKTDKDKKGKIF